MVLVHVGHRLHRLRPPRDSAFPATPVTAWTTAAITAATTASPAAAPTASIPIGPRISHVRNRVLLP